MSPQAKKTENLRWNAGERFLKDLREKVIQAFEELEGSSFERTSWDYQNGEGGGEMAVLRGNIFEKAAVNFSEIRGETFPGSDGKGPFFATGVSLITHMQNPHAPTVHMNMRYIETDEESWYGGGYDLTPMGFPYDDDTKHFHAVAKKASGDHYDIFSQNAKEYFYIPHRGCERGVGGLFFDHFSNQEVWQDIGESFLDAIMPIYARRIDIPYSESDKEEQYRKRAVYAEFNLAYDRGTRFGFLSGGNLDAILCSMPPVAKW